MLTSTFIHVPGVGATTEKRLWQNGIRTWADALAASPSDLPLTAAQRSFFRPTIEASACALEQGDYAYFARTLPGGDQWRAAPEFMDRVGFLDIETNGGNRPEDITVVGVYDGDESHLYVKYRDLDRFAEDAGGYALFVTYYGGGFDIPFLRRRFPDLPFDQLHIDLCPALRRLGYKGGLKAVETRIGIRRTPEVDGLNGWDAVQLWRAWRRRGDEDALKLLLDYNRADIENLSLLLAFAYGRLKAATGFPPAEK